MADAEAHSAVARAGRSGAGTMDVDGGARRGGLPRVGRARAVEDPAGVREAARIFWGFEFFPGEPYPRSCS